jgi:hypothetical protein
MNDSDRIDDLRAQYGWSLVDGPVIEAETTRATVELESGDEALLYVFGTEEAAARAALAHSEDFGAQLFAIPERIESGLDWLLMQPIDGDNLSELLGDDGLSALKDHEIDAVVSGVARILSKLHSVTTDGYGDILPSRENDRFLTFNGWAARQLEIAAEGARESGIDDATVGMVGEAVGELRHELAAYHPRTPAGLVHGRPHLEHFWVDPKTYEVVALTGLHHMASLPREIDIAIFLWIVGVGARDESIRTFYQAYGAARTMDVQRRERFFRRLAAFMELSGRRGPSPRTSTELVGLTAR